MYNFITNPESNRKVSIFTKKGRSILQRYFSLLGGHNGPCALNNGTNRCKKS